MELQKRRDTSARKTSQGDMARDSLDGLFGRINIWTCCYKLFPTWPQGLAMACDIWWPISQPVRGDDRGLGSPWRGGSGRLLASPGRLLASSGRDLLLCWLCRQCIVYYVLVLLLSLVWLASLLVWSLLLVVVVVVVVAAIAVVVVVLLCVLVSLLLLFMSVSVIDTVVIVMLAMNVYVYRYVHTHIHEHTYIYLYIYIYVRHTYVYVYKCIVVYIYI